MHSTLNDGKSIVAERFIKLWMVEIIKYDS